MDRLTRQMVSAEQQVGSSGKQLADVEDVLEQALTVAGNCNLHYQAAPDFVRRQINQGFFEKLWIAQDGSIEPFAALLGVAHEVGPGSTGQ